MMKNKSELSSRGSRVFKGEGVSPLPLKAEVCINELLCKACGYCIEACPKKVLEFATHFNPGGFHPVRVAKKEECTGCGLCYQVCPEIAIEVNRE